MMSVRRMLAALAVASCLAATPAGADTVEILSLQSGHSTVVDAPGLTRVAVGDGRIAGIVPIGTQQVVINGKGAGHTSVFIWSGSRRTDYEVTVTEQSADDAVTLLRTAIGDPHVQVLNLGRSILLRGTVADDAKLAQVNDVVNRFSGIKLPGAGDQKIAIVNAVTIARPFGVVPGDLARMGSGLRIDQDGKGNVIVSGRVKDRATAEAILERAKGLAGAFLATDGKVVDRLAVDATSQVNVKVYILEVDRTAQTQLGLRLQSGTIDPTSGVVAFGAASFPIFENPITGALPGKALNVGGFERTTFLAPTIDLLAQEGHARVLSSPNLTTMPGKEATFLVGGEVPYAYSSGLGATSIVFKEYGVKLVITPTILGNGGIDTKIAPEVSDLDFADGIELNGFVVPALKTSRLSTDVVTQPGESIVMGGLLRRIDNRTITKIPVLGDLPVLGRLFRSTAYQRGDTDVVFVMTPEVINR